MTERAISSDIARFVIGAAIKRGVFTGQIA
jgi:hypothetical protein